MNEKEILKLIEFGRESDYLDFKKEQYKNHENLLKDVMALANSKYQGNKYIIIGIKYTPGNPRKVIGISPEEFKDSAEYQQLIHSNITPEIDLDYYKYEYKDNLLGILEIKNCNNKPYLMQKNYGRIQVGTCLVRKGSYNAFASREDYDSFSNELKESREVEKQKTSDYYNSNKIYKKCTEWNDVLCDAIRRKLIRYEDYNFFNSTDYFSLSYKETFTVQQAINDYKFIILLAEAGEGKSTLLKKTFIELVTSTDETYIPIYVSLNTYNGEDFYSFIERDYGNVLSTDKNKLLFLFDEFDQVKDKDIATKKIHKFIADFKDSKFLIASRSNAYSAHFSDAYLFHLMPLSIADIEKYAKNKIKYNHEEFIRRMHEKRYIDFVKNPFNLEHMIQFYKKQFEIPKSKSIIIENIINSSIENILINCEEDLKFKDTYSKEAVKHILQKISLFMEITQKNYVSLTELQNIVPEKEARYIIKGLDIFKKSFIQEQPTFQFQHNNYNEYLCAEALNTANLSFIKELISLTDIDFENINPSWKNSLSFLLELRKNDDLLNYLIQIDPKYLLDFEFSRLSYSQRVSIFKEIFEKYTLKKIWIDVDLKRLANIAKEQEIFEYLSNYILTAEHYVYRYNAISLIQYFKEFTNDALKKMLINIAVDTAENITVRSLSFSALSKLGYTNTNIINQLLKVTSEKENKRVIVAFYSLLCDSPDINNFINVLLEGIPLVRTRLSDNFFLSGHTILKGLEKIDDIDCLIQIIQYFANNVEDLRDSYIARYIPHLVNQAVSKYSSSNSIYFEMKKLLWACSKSHLKKLTQEIKSFFVSTGTLNNLFNDHYHNLSTIYDYQLVGLLLNEELANIVINDYTQRLDEQNIRHILNAVLMTNPNEHEKLKGIILTSTGISDITPINYEERQAETLKKQISIIFSKELYLNEIKKIYTGERKEILSDKDLQFDMIWDEHTHDYKYKNFIIWDLEDILKSGRKSFEEVKKWVDNYDYDVFILQKIYELMQGNNLEISEEQVHTIKNICFTKINQVDFKTSVQYKEDGFSTPLLYIYLWYFQHKFQFQYSEEILLDMLSFDWLISNEFLGISYIEELVDINLIKIRILNNLKNDNMKGQILINHIDFCNRHRIYKSFNSFKKIVEDKDISLEARKKALETLINLDIEVKYLLETLKITDNEVIFNICAQTLIEKNNSQVEEVLLNKIREDTLLALQASILLIKTQNIEAINYYINHIKKKKVYSVDFHNKPLLLIRTPKAVNLLLNLLLLVMKEKIQQKEFERLDEDIYTTLKQIALQGESELKHVISSLDTFIKSNTTLKNINFLYIIQNQIIDLYKVNYRKKINYLDVISTVNKLLHIPTNAQYQEKIILCIKIQKEIIEKCKLYSLQEIFEVYPNTIINAAYLVTLGLSKNQSQFENFINYLQQMFYETIPSRQRKTNSYFYETFNDLFSVVNRIRCLRHYYHHIKLSDSVVKQVIKNEFLRLGEEPNTSDKWAFFHNLIVDDLLNALLNTESKLP